MTENTNIRYVEELEKLIAQQGWDLIRHNRASWWSFSRPNRRNVAFGIMLKNEQDVYLYIKRVHTETKTSHNKAANYSQDWDQDEFLLEPGITNLSDFLPLLKLAYSRS